MSNDNTDRKQFVSLLDDYLDGRLDRGDTQKIKSMLKEDASLNEVLRQHVKMRTAIRHAGESDLKSKLTDNFESRSETGKSNLFKLVLALLMLLPLTLASYFYFSSQKISKLETPQELVMSEDLLLASVEDPSYNLLRSKNNGAMTDLWQEALQAFSAKNYSEVFPILKTLEQDVSFLETHRGKISLMQGVAHLKLENFKVAESALLKIEKSNPYYDQAEWYLALNHYYSGDKNKAQISFRKIAHNKEHYKKKQAELYLTQLNK